MLRQQQLTAITKIDGLGSSIIIVALCMNGWCIDCIGLIMEPWRDTQNIYLHSSPPWKVFSNSWSQYHLTLRSIRAVAASDLQRKRLGGPLLHEVRNIVPRNYITTTVDSTSTVSKVFVSCLYVGVYMWNPTTSNPHRSRSPGATCTGDPPMKSRTAVHRERLQSSDPGRWSSVAYVCCHHVTKFRRIYSNGMYAAKAGQHIYILVLYTWPW